MRHEVDIEVSSKSLRLVIKLAIKLETKDRAKALALVLIRMLAWRVVKGQPSEYYISEGWLNC